MNTLEKEMDKITKLLAQAKIEMENASFVWGKTECKYGLLDIKK